MSVRDAKESLQLAFYTIAANADESLAGDVAAAELWYPASRTSQSVAVRSLDMDLVEDIKVRLGSTADGIFAESWEPRVSTDCERCRVRQLCPAWPEGNEAFG